MKARSGIAARAATLVVLAAFATACSGSDHGSAANTKPTATAASSGAGSGGKPVGNMDFDTVFNDKNKLRLALPDPASMREWTPKRGDAYIAEPQDPSECGPDAAWHCARVANGVAEFEDVGEHADFKIDAFADRKTAQDACRKEAAWSAKYAKADVPPVSDLPSHAYYRNAGGLNGIYLTMCAGTVVATTFLEGGSMDPATLHTLAGIFATRIQKAAAGS